MEALRIFRMIASEFKDMPDEDVADAETGEVQVYGVKSYMELYANQISKKRFGNLYEKALAYLTAHKLKMSGQGDDSFSGKIADSLRLGSYSEGETSISYNGSQANLGADGEYALTVYGLEFLAIRHAVIIPILCAGEGLPYGCPYS